MRAWPATGNDLLDDIPIVVGIDMDMDDPFVQGQLTARRMIAVALSGDPAPLVFENE
jgi:hypothetical protein